MLIINIIILLTLVQKY